MFYVPALYSCGFRAVSEKGNLRIPFVYTAISISAYLLAISIGILLLLLTGLKTARPRVLYPCAFLHTKYQNDPPQTRANTGCFYRI